MRTPSPRCSHTAPSLRLSLAARLLALRPCRASPQTLGDFTDFSKVGFTIATTAGKTITVKADRCGGSCSYAVVTVDGEEKFRSMTPDDELKAKVDAQQAADAALQEMTDDNTEEKLQALRLRRQQECQVRPPPCGAVRLPASVYLFGCPRGEADKPAVSYIVCTAVS